MQNKNKTPIEELKEVLVFLVENSDELNRIKNTKMEENPQV